MLGAGCDSPEVFRRMILAADKAWIAEWKKIDPATAAEVETVTRERFTAGLAYVGGDDAGPDA
jgi:hypothetical protein